MAPVQNSDRRDVICFACGIPCHFAIGCGAFLQQGTRSVGSSIGAYVKQDGRSMGLASGTSDAT
ncbi:hypothetical protein DPMN_080792 [Dreissena polymorpha]|uniref:Uncharacterized protein n=1 Tax=Dreissena polymorpha TaxID=45954 RepID=A0A9D3YVU5_DREPO|nr:hypothetical protein DPMN_080792 [Dreissena polymorpha]